MTEPGKWPSAAMADMAEASGCVTDKRRLVCALYLLMRDHVLVQEVTTAFNRLRPGSSAWVKWPECTASMDYGSIHQTRDRASRLHDYPTPKLHAFLFALWVTNIVWSEVDKLTPLRDDTSTVFSNGWLAGFAQYLADELLA